MTDRSSRKVLSKLAFLFLLVFLVVSMSGCISDEKKYEKAVAMVNAGQYDEAIAAFTEIEQYEDSKIFIMYTKTLQLAESGEYALAASTFESMEGFRDSKYLGVYYNARHAEKEMRYEDADALYRTIVTFSDSADRLSALPDLILQRDFNAAAEGLYDGYFSPEDEEAIAYFMTRTYSDSPTRMLEEIYAHADAVLAEGDYETAYCVFSMLAETEYGDSAARIDDYYLVEVRDLMSGQDYSSAYACIHIYLPGNAEAQPLLKECAYHLAEESKAEGCFNDAYVYYVEAGDYADAADKAAAFESDYAAAQKLLEEDKFDEAYAAFIALKDYSNSATQAQACIYQKGLALLEAAEYDSAIAAFKQVSDYEDAVTMEKKCHYLKGQALLENAEYDAAAAAFQKASDYEDAAAMAKESIYQKGEALMADEKYDMALQTFRQIPDYKDASFQIETCCSGLYDDAMRLYNEGTYIQAWQVFRMIPDYQDAFSLIQSCASLLNHSLAASCDHTVGLKADGTVAVVGNNEYGPCNVNGWTNIEAVSFGSYHIVGLKADGTVVAGGYNENNQ